MYIQGKVRATFGWIFLDKLIFREGFGLFCLVISITAVELGPMKEAFKHLAHIAAGPGPP